ncbi:alkaline phosphatase [Paenibacillus sp. J31TS4]|uniref:DedA family protein n=1 Tax=Paenibacillus sp. J31TS4 TaxID=2807195 RepID=UPI001B04E72F|nr:DedA family protein [Paenibacillus sp. J31TS4]GIP37110.1 alkaline phosphatase [Paenibacillus sp. J31TS4]
MDSHHLLSLVAHYGYLGIFCALMLGLIGLPVPDEVLMAFCGYLIATGRLHYLPTVLTAAAGSFVGMSFSYFIGRQFGRPLLEKYGKYVHLTPDKFDRTQHWLDKYGKFALTLGYFVPGLRHLTSYSAGISRWSYGSFSLYVASGAVLWAASFITLGMYLGEHWHRVLMTVHRYSLLLILALLALGGVYLVYRKRRRVRAER